MGIVFSWWLAAELVGLMSLPLAATVLANLPDRGWTLAKPLGIVVLGWLIWFPLSVLGVLPYSGWWILGTFLAYALANGALLRRSETREALRGVWARARGHVIASEALFAAGLVFMALVRAYAPEVRDTEKFMDVAFLSSLWRADHLPAPDPWLSGYPINYYYFGHFLLASFAKVLGTQPGTAFNVGIALIFALAALAIYAVATNLTALVGRGRDRALSRGVPFGLAAVFLVLLAGNLAGAQQWWKDALAATAYTPALHGNPWAWWSDRALWGNYGWWFPSRVIPLAAGGSTINEFPSFSFVLADLHAHVLALPFAALAVGVALNVLLARGEGLRAFGSGRLLWLGVGTAAVALGSLYAINGWDLPTYLGLALLAVAIQQWLVHDRQFASRLFLNAFAAGAVLAALSVLLYVPFYRGFVSPSQGFAAVPPMDRTQVGYELVIFGLPLFVLLTLLIVWLARWAGEAAAAYVGGDEATSTGARASWFDWVASPRVLAISSSLLVVAVLAFLTAKTPANQGWTLFWAVALLLGCGALVVRHLRGRADAEAAAEPSAAMLGEVWLLCLVGLAAALVAACELVYLLDIFNSRMNTVFKLYYQAWLLLGIAAAPALSLLFGTVSRTIRGLLPSTHAPHGRAASSASVPPVIAVAAAGSSVPSGSLRRWDVSVTSGGGEAGGASGQGLAITATPATRYAPLPAALRYVPAAGMLLWTVALVVLVAATLIFPVLAFSSRTGNFGWRPGASGLFSGIGASGGSLTLDGTAYMVTDSAQAPGGCSVAAGSNLGDGSAIDWLNRNISGSPVIVEAPGCEWSHYSRISAFTGLPTLLGWPGGHEGEWRVNWLAQQLDSNIFDERKRAIDTIYTTPDKQTVLALLKRYDARYVYVGIAERNLYSGADLDRFTSFLRTVYRRDGVTIYAAP